MDHVGGHLEAGVLKADVLGSRLDLRRRIVSAVVLATLGLLGLFAGVLPFAFLVLSVALVMSWEWCHLVRSSGGRRFSFRVHAVAVTLAVLAAAHGWEELALASVGAGALALLIMNFRTAPGVSVLGVVYVGIPAIALVCLRGSDSFGLLAVLFVFAVVWAGDSAAFIGGTLIGGPKLYPQISPNKTWAGLLSAILAAIVVGVVFALLLEDGPGLYLVVCAAGLGVAGQLGDLAESALKRVFRVKDSSDLIPGHGGFLDRMDGIVAAGSVALVVGLMVNSEAPARALLYGM